MKHWMFRCQDVSRKISQSLDVTLPLRQRVAVRIHLMMCRFCSRFYRQVLLLRKMSRLDNLDSPTGQTAENLPEATKKRIKAKLRASL